jgi:acetyl esterase/lipase
MAAEAGFIGAVMNYRLAPDHGWPTGGEDVGRAVSATLLPLLVVGAEFDPPRFQSEFLGLLTERLSRHGTMPRSFVALGHNHYSAAMHLGTKDRRLADEIVQFVKDVCHGGTDCTDGAA